MALLHQHTSAKNTTRKAATSATTPHQVKTLDAATCQLKCSLLSKYSHVLQLCGCEAGLDLCVTKAMYLLVRSSGLLMNPGCPQFTALFVEMRGWSLNTCCCWMRLCNFIKGVIKVLTRVTKKLLER